VGIGRAGVSRKPGLAKLCGMWALAVVSVLLPTGPPASASECPNQALRTGASAGLPACRAYEMVSPADSNGRVLQAINTGGLPANGPELFPTELAAASGNSIVFMAYMSPLPELRGATGVADVYEAARGVGGWSTNVLLGPSGAQVPGGALKPGGVSSDHGYTTGVLSAPKGGWSPNLFGRDGSVEPIGLGSSDVEEPYPQTRYISAGGEHIIFSTGLAETQSVWCSTSGGRCKVLQLEPEAPPTGTGAVYDRSADGPTHVVSLLPGNAPLKTGEQAFYKGTSKDASSVAFEVGGTLYVRIHNGAGGETTEKVAEGAPVFAGVSDQGRYVFYVPGGDKGTIHRFDTVTKGDIPVNPGTEGEIVNVSGDGSHVYFISEEEIGGEGVDGKPNLYVWSGGSPSYVVTVAPSDLDQTSPNPGSFDTLPALTRWTSWVTNPNEGHNQGPGADSSRTTPDGNVLVFESRAKLTPYDNTGCENAEGCTEIYRYDDEDKGLVCVSCNFGNPAKHDARLENLRFLLPMAIVHNVSDDGSRIFLETVEPLVEGDTDGLNDVYEWQAGSGGGDSIGLISSGKSIDYPLSPIVELAGVSAAAVPPPNTLLSVTPDAGNVVFLSQDALVDGAPEGGVAIYDARTGGGFPTPSVPTACLEDGCKPAPAQGPPTSSPGSASESLRGRGNVKSHRTHRHCRSKKHPKRKPCAKGHGNHRSHEGTRHRSHNGARASASTSTPTAQQSASGTSSPSAVRFSGTSGAAGPSASTSVTSGCVPGYGFESVSTELSTPTAGSHPNFTTNLALNHYFLGGLPQACQTTEEVSVSLPPGLLGNPNAVGRCKTGELLAFNCPLNSQVGIAHVLVVQYGDGFDLPVYNMELPHPGNEIARLGFLVTAFPVYLDVRVRTASDYGVTATVFGPSGLSALLTAKTTLWAEPSDPAHDEERIFAPCEQFCGPRPVPRTGLAFMTNPSACQAGQVGFVARSYQLPGQDFGANAPLPQVTDCSGLPFAPTFDAEPTSHVAGAPTGLKTKLVLPQHLGAGERGTATMREARVTLPAGMQVAAGAANWIGVCSPQEVGFHEEVDVECPNASKLGTATIKSPALPSPIEGTIFQRTPEPGHQLGLWLTSDALGMHIKLPGELEPDRQTGRLTAVFRDLPQVPVEEIDLNVWGGPRAPLQNPDRCGTYATDLSFAPHSQDPPVTGQSQIRIDEGCGQPFTPTLQAGVTKPVAGRFSPLIVDLTRGDGQQALRGFELELPDGELARIKGVPLCPNAAAAAGGCPADSAIGSLSAVTGPGPEPLSLPQPGKGQPRIFLGGPYQGSPFSIVTEVPAQAGPFDLGVLAVRSGLGLDPDTNRAVVRADPLPQFFEGVGLTYRHLHAVIDRPHFSLNPTDCSELRVTSAVTSTEGAIAHPSARFQVDRCKRLKFKPKLTLKLDGGTKRGDYPALTATLKVRKADANIARTSVGLPHSEFLAQEHIATICTRKQFAADKCPKRSVYGRAKAWTPLLAKPLEGPVYLRSSSHPLPDLVAALGGELDVNLVGRIDSTRFGGIRTSFEAIPDARVTKFVLRMRGGSKSLLVNSTDICLHKHRAEVAMRAQNGRSLVSRPVLESGGCEPEGRKPNH
jgi:hypothetical protein